MVNIEKIKDFIVLEKKEDEFIESNYLYKDKVIEYLRYFNKNCCCICNKNTKIVYNINLKEKPICDLCARRILKQYVLEL